MYPSVVLRRAFSRKHFSNVWKGGKTCVGLSLNQWHMVSIDIYIISNTGHLHNQLLKPLWENVICWLMKIFNLEACQVVPIMSTCLYKELLIHANWTQNLCIMVSIIQLNSWGVLCWAIYKDLDVMSQKVSKQQEALEEMKKQFETASTELASSRGALSDVMN